MDNLAADFEINPNNPLNAEYELGEGASFDCSFELFASGTVWGNINGDINNQTDLINLLNTKVDLTSFEELSQTVTNNYNELTGDISDLTTTVTDNYNTLSGQISDLTTTVNNNYTSLDNRLTTAEGSILDLTDTVSDNYTDLNNKITDNTDDITTIQNTINSYGDIVTYDAANFATSAQGLLADTALQPNDNISELNNNVGYITGIDSSDVTTALGYTPYDSSNPAGYITSASLPTVNDGTLTIQVNGVDLTTFSANQAANATANIIVPDSATWGNITGTLSNQTDLQTALNSKQATLTQTQLDAVNSGANTINIGQITINQNNIADIRDLIPLQASTSNQLADKNFVNSSIATNTAYFIGTFNSVAELEAYSGPLTNNDYAFVATTDSAGNTLYDRYKYNADTQQWIFEYELNNSSFTAQQWASINSGITSGDVTLIGTALQPNDNISELTNDAGYITSSALTNYVTTNTDQTISGTKTFSTISVSNITNALNTTILRTYAGVTNVGSTNSQLLLKSNLERPYFNNTSNTLALSSDIPTVNNGTLDIQVNGTSVGTFTANQSGNTTANIVVPDSATWGNITGTLSNQTDLQTALNSKYDASNPSGYTSNIGTVTSVNNVSPVSGNVTLSIPSATSDLTNDSGFITSSDLTNYVTTNTTQTISADKTFTGILAFQNGSGNACITLGADVGATTLTSGTRKLGRMNFHTQDLNVNCAFVSTDSQDGVNYVEFGGRTGDQTNTAPDVLRFTVANVHNSKSTSDKFYPLIIDKTSASFTVQPKYNNVNLATETYVDTGLATKQDTLVSGTNIKTINSTSILGSGNISVATSAQGALADTALQPNDNITELTNNAGYITSSALAPYALSADLATVATTGAYSDLSGTPTIPTTISDLTDDTATYPIDKAESVVDNNSGSLTFWSGTKAQYDAIVTKDANTLYNVEDTTSPIISILDSLYPVGSIYIGTMSACPLQTLGIGTWQLVATDKVLQGAGTRGAVGTTLNESLPNVKSGSWGGILANYDSTEIEGGAVRRVSNTANGNATSGDTRSFYNFDASRSSSTYQDNAPVQQDAYLVNIWERIS